MKKILWVLLLAFCVGFVQAAPSAVTAGSRRQAMVEKYGVKKISADEFLKAVSKGDTALIGQVKDLALLKAQDKFGNNCFHLAKNKVTLLTIAAVARQLNEEDYLTTFQALRDQRNHMGETPLMYHINIGKTEMFEELYRGSSLQNAIRTANAVNNKGAALVNTANVRIKLARQEGSDFSGRTVADAAKANGLQEVVQFFENHAPYMFTK